MTRRSVVVAFIMIFFFSSRRRHTRFDCDWSSDVCSSDLHYGPRPLRRAASLEKAFAQAMGARHALAVTSGTAALITALAALGIGPGDEVAVPTCTWIATINAVVILGAVPLFVDIDESLNMDAS